MRVAVYYNNNDIRIVTVSKPQVKHGEVLLKVMACGICGSDVMEWYRVRRAPLVLGHEVVGFITEVGEGVEKYKVGDRVFVSHHVPCNTCRFCLRGEHTACETLHKTNIDPGGFSEYARVPSINVDRGVFKLPEEVTFEEGVFTEPLACVLRSQRRLPVRVGDSVLVMGSGVSGILHIQIARLLGASRIISTDIHRFKLEAAERFGADEVIDAGKDVLKVLREMNHGRLADVVIVSTNAPSAIRQSFDCVEDAGRILFFAPAAPGFEAPLNLNDFWSRQLSLATSYAAAPSDLNDALELIRARRVNVKDMVTHRLSLCETPLGFRLVSEASDALKVVVEPQR
ncbi:zinc-dependent dehydrogenase [Candidatus Bathyarchaeota archaeon]|nr:zinc-dependent dehydrogenase [Candidatus Bathyarchaeota archaeon]